MFFVQGVPCTKTRHALTAYRSLTSVHVFFFINHPFAQPPKSNALQSFSISHIPQKCLFQWWYLHSMFPGPTLFSIPNCISIGSAVHAFRSRESLYFTVCCKTWL